MDRYFVKKGESLRENLDRVTSGRTYAWLERQGAKWSCRSCGAPTFWDEKYYSRYGKPLK
jgi:hypothetical protein